MFTGLIQDIGTITAVALGRREAELTVKTSLSSPARGESVSVMGACLTVIGGSRDGFSAFASEETLERTGFRDIRAGSRVNLERALKAGDPLGGHIVTGHVDARVKLLARQRVTEAERLSFALPEARLASQIANKGSVAVDGVSLTVNQVRGDSFDVMIIPLTLKETTLGSTEVGTMVNIETDILAKYIARRLDGQSSGGVDMALLERSGFLR